MPVVALLLVAVLTLAAGPASAPAGAAVPRGFFGVMADGPLLDDPRVPLERELDLMRSNGVQSVRVAFYWRSMQPRADVPPDFTETDRIVRALTARGIDVLPILLRAPAWATDGDEREGAVPELAAYAAWVETTVARYRGRVRRWQVWNEPDIGRYWVGRPWPATYAPLLRAGSAAIRRADPAAQVVAAGLTGRSWEGIAELYRQGARGSFDLAAIHPFSRRVENTVKIVGLVRAAMRRAGDGATPLVLSEISYSSGRGRSTMNYGWEFDEAGQARQLRALLRRLAAERRRLGIAAAYWYTWLSPPVGDAESFSYGGLRRLSGGGIVAKPALAAFRAAVRSASR